MIIYPIGTEKSITTTTTISASYVNLLNNHESASKVSIIDLDGNAVSTFTLAGHERVTVVKPYDYGLSASHANVLAVPLIRTQ